MKIKKILDKINPIKLLYGSVNFVKEYLIFKNLSKHSRSRFELNWLNCFPCLTDKTASTDYDHHYIYHTAWAARILAKTKPEYHVDISSSIYFNAIVSAFVPIKFYDYRPANVCLSDLTSEFADLFKLPFADNSLNSISCMHTVEHIGLGRYGDPLDYDGDLKAYKELKRVVANGGNLLLVVPIGGKAKIMFNAHRIYTYSQITEYFSDMVLNEFAIIPDNPSDYERGIILEATEKIANCQNFACGCFWFKKGM